MDNWVPNPHARPYIPRQRSRLIRVCGPCLSHRRKFSLTFKACLLLTLAVTLFINISFILNSNKASLPGVSQTVQLSRDSYKTDTDDTDSVAPIKTVQQHIVLDVFSNKSLVFVKVNGKPVLYNNDTTDNSRGIHVVVLNQATAAVMAISHFDTYLSTEDEALILFLENLSAGRIIVFTVKDEATFNLKAKCREVLTRLGSQYAESIAWRDTWAFVTVNWEKPYGEVIGKSPALDKWGEFVQLRVNMTLTNNKATICPLWPNTKPTVRRRKFCSQYEGYGDLCHCDKPITIDFQHKPLPDGGFLNIAVSVIASNRPQYLFRMLKTLVQTPGVPLNNVTVFIDGYYDEPKAVSNLFGIKAIQHTPHGLKNSRISQHYKASITATFERFPKSEYIILLEEDLDVSPDFFFYMKQTLPILEEDATLYCISAWNDQGYEHSCKDPSLLYRVETMPGLGWMMKKSLFIDELLPQWPSIDKQWDWDLWMRNNVIRKDRECIIPDVSRTYHFGSKGLNVNPYFQELYFKNHKIQKEPNVILKDINKNVNALLMHVAKVQDKRMKSKEYEELIEDLIQHAKVLDHSKDPCSDDFLPVVDADTFVMYIHMNTTKDFQTWKLLAKCYKLWDLDVRGFHKSMWRQFYKEKHLVIVGVPASPYAKFKPTDVKPIFLEEKKDNNKGR